MARGRREAPTRDLGPPAGGTPSGPLVALVAFLLGLVTAASIGYAAPNPLYERRVVNYPSSDSDLRAWLDDGWIVVDDTNGFLTIARPRLRLP